MSIYEELGIRPFVNASEPYTRNGGSVMADEVVKAMEEASRSFVNMEELIAKASDRAAQLTGNEGAFITSGAGAGVVLAAVACMCAANPAEKHTEGLLPHTDDLEKNEILIFRGKYLDMIEYWKLTAISGARIRIVDPSGKAMLDAVGEKTAAVFLFPAPMYEEGIPACEEIIPALKRRGVRVVADAAAQLPPVSNLWYYTGKLGADLAVFSGGKHIGGPQATGLIVGKKELTEYCRQLACPNPRLGRVFKTGKEEIAGFLKALELFTGRDEKKEYSRQENMLRYVEEQLRGIPGISLHIQSEGRLGTEQPLLLVELPGDRTGEDCNRFTRAFEQPVDIGYFKKENGRPHTVFVNAYLLKAGEEKIVAAALRAYLGRSG